MIKKNIVLWNAQSIWGLLAGHFSLHNKSNQNTQSYTHRYTVESVRHVHPEVGSLSTDLLITDSR